MRTKNTLKTFLYGIFFTSIIAVLGLIKTKIMLNSLGSEYVGVYQLFYQIFTYISLVDGGIGASIAFHLYKPINDNDTDKINEIIAGANSYFKKIGFLIIILGIFLSFGIMFLIKETTISAIYIKICFILFIISSSFSYFTSAHATLYEAEQKLYKSSNLNHMLSIAESIVVIIVSLLGGKLMTILTIFLVLSLLKNVILVLNSRKDHKYLHKTSTKDLSFKSEANGLIVNKINTLIYENVDVIIISKFLGLNFVFIYTAYNQIISMITQMIKRLNSALLPSIGNLLVAEKEKAQKTFSELNSLIFFIGSILFVPLYYMLTPFIGLWYGNEYTISKIVCLLFVLILYINILKIPLETYIKAAGEFKSVKNSSIYQSISNLVLSIILVQFYGIGGILFATVFAFLTGNFIHYPKIICKKIINSKIVNYYKKCLKYLIGLIINLIICYFINTIFKNTSLIYWIMNGIILFIINFILTYIYYWITKENIFVNRIKYIFKNFYKKSKSNA